MQKNKGSLIALILILVGLGYYWYANRPSQKQLNPIPIPATENTRNHRKDFPKNIDEIPTLPIDQLTAENVVVPFIKKNGHLPAYYIKKRIARERGWVASEGNLCNVLPGKAIGGDVFTNRQKILPSKNNRIWYEADLNYKCGRRNADRLLFSNDQLIFVTKDHYKTFEEK